MIRPPKPLSRYGPPITRLLRPRVMTIAAGMVCNDGIVIAADSQESWTDGKTYVNKLSVLNLPNGPKVVLAGSGVGWFVDYARDKIFNLFRDKEIKQNGDIQPQISLLMSSLYENEFRSFPGKIDRGVGLLICAKIADEPPKLVSCDSTLVRPVEAVRLVGTESLSDEADTLQKIGLNLAQTRWACAYLVWKAKWRSSDVGGKTYVSSLDNSGKLHAENAHVLRQREHLFERTTDLALLLLLSANPATPELMVKHYSRWISKAIQASRREFKAAEDSQRKQAKEIARLKDRALKSWINET